MNNKYKFLSFPFVILLLLSLCFFIFFFGVGNYGLLDKDEPRYAGTALEMLKNNDWIIPKFNFENRFDKPILFYWLIAISYKLFGISDFISRLPSAVCATLCIFFTWYTVKIVFGRKTAFLSAVILATSVEFVLLGRRAATDMALCLFFTGSLYSIFLSYYIKDFRVKIVWCILAGVFCGLSILTKGPVGVLLPLIILTGFLLVKRQADVRHLKVYFIILFFALIVSLPWYFMVHCATNGQFTQEFFFEHNLKRFTSVVGEHPGPFWFYLPIVLGGFMPWTLFLILSLVTFLNPKVFFKKNSSKFMQFCIVWISVVFFFFSFSTTKLATYILLLFPPLSILTGYWIMILSKRKPAVLKNILSLITLLFIPVFLFMSKLLLKWNIEETDKNPLLIKMALAVTVLFLGTLFSFLWLKKSYALVLGFALSFITCFVVGLNSYLVPYYKYTHADLRTFAELAKKLGTSKIISFGMYRPSLVYYSGVPVDFSSKLKQIKEIKTCGKDCKISVIGHTSDIQQHRNLFQRISIINARNKYFVGTVK